MKIIMLTLMSGPDGTAQPGDVLDVLDEIGSGLVSGGYASRVIEPTAKAASPVVERAIIAQHEAAVAPAGRIGKRGR